MKRLFTFVLAIASVVVISGSVAQSTRTLLDLRTGPIINSGDVANLALVLSVEFPTVGAAYKARGANSYVATKKYMGYFNSSSCYRYAGTSADGYFEPSGATDANYQCNLTGTGTGWSGNLMNFLNTSSIDVLRLALTGGDRYVDEVGRTILQRAILPSDARSSGSNRNTNFYAGGTNDAGNWAVVTLSAGTRTAALTPFGSSTAVVVKACDDKIFFGTTNTGQCDSPGNNANLAVASSSSPSTTVTGTFKARVLVCSATEGPTRTDLCRQQPDGNFKPVGEIQKNSDRVRVAAFGYLIDSATWGTGLGNSINQEGGRYGGVLRAPMKFAGPYQKSSAGIVSANTQTEWNENTGVFVTKPIDTSNETGFTTTGVINYINKFGRLTRSDGVGIDVYKRRDPVGELYYEAIRYFQGMQPTAGAVEALDDTLRAGYPVYTNWTDPMQTSCQRNYAMLVGDNNASRDGFIPGSAVSGQTRGAETRTVGTGSVVLNAATWTNLIQSFERNEGVAYTDAQGVSRAADGNSSDPITGIKTANSGLATSDSSADKATYLYAGVAYWANTQSIRPDKPLARVRTYVLDVDEGGNGTLDANTRSNPKPRFSAMYLAGKYGGFSDVGPDQSPSSGEGNPFRTYVNGTLTSSTSEWLAADGSTSPTGYFLASQPERVILAVRQIFAQASKPSGNLAGGSLSVSRLSQAQQQGAFYQAQINSTDWSGTLIRTQLVFNTATQNLDASTTPIWDAANILTGIQSGTTTLAPFPLPQNRNILSYSSTNRKGVTFTWASSNDGIDGIDTEVKNSLRKDPSLADPGVNNLPPETDGQARLNYIRGVRTAESDPDLNYRARRVLMGDSINSAPVLKGAPSADILDVSYRPFVAAHAARTPTVYLGTNDGMLHAFYAGESTSDPNNGKELFAYVPRAVSLKLNKLTDPGYVKEAYVDGAMAVNEARIFRATPGASPGVGAVDWGTALVSGMGGGARGLFALDVTNPESFHRGNVLWEFTDADDPEMGHLLAEPKIVKLAVGGNGNATPDYKWFAMVTSGYNNYGVRGTGEQSLFLLSLEKAPGTSWTLNQNYFKIKADNSAFATTSPTVPTGLGMPAIATGIAGNTLYAYAGDLQGNLWRWDLRGASDTWNFATTPATVLFVAKNGAGTATQPITVVPAVTLNPVRGYQIGFGTGKFIEPSDALPTSAAQQSLYSIWDSGDGKTFDRLPSGPEVAGVPSINGLITRTLTASAGTATVSISGSPFTYGTSAVPGSGQYRGWVADLSTTMERVVVDPTVSTGVMAVNSTIPSGDACSATGASNQYRYNPNTGITFVTRATQDSQGYLGSASLLQVGETNWTTRSSSGRYVVTRRIDSVSPGVGGGVSMRQSTVTTIAGRISWREITNFQ